MTRAVIMVFLVATALKAAAQFPLTRTMELRTGIRKPQVRCLVQDGQGMLWAGTDKAVLRTDGDQAEIMLRTEGAEVMSMQAHGSEVFAVLRSGHLIRFSAQQRDTILHEPLWERSPVRSMTITPDGTIWLGSYGTGVWVIDRKAGGPRISKVGGSPDDHVNAIIALDQERVVMATDQGMAVCGTAGVTRVLDETAGIPDNLVLCLDRDEEGTIWAGTDRGGIFSWSVDGGVEVYDLGSEFKGRAVHAIAAHGGMLWAALEGGSIIAMEGGSGKALYQWQGERADRHVIGFMKAADGTTFWWQGTDRMHMADPDILLVPEHEGMELGHITALCSDHKDRIWFATKEGVFNHERWFSSEGTIRSTVLRSPKRMPAVSMAAATDGSLWMTTFGDGVVHLSEKGMVTHYSSANGLPQDNVLAVDLAGDQPWFATLSGPVTFKNGRFVPVPHGGSGFHYDVLAMPDGTVLAATDGAGVVRIEADSVVQLKAGPRTFHSLTLAPDGHAWAVGPGTGLCLVTREGMLCKGKDLPVFEGDILALEVLGQHIVVFGQAATMAYHPPSDAWVDVTARFGLEGISAELNTACRDASGALWFACDKGLLRIKPSQRHFNNTVPTVLNDILAGGKSLSGEGAFDIPHDLNDITIRFAGIHYADPGALRFAYRITPGSGEPIMTRDRQVRFVGLRPGRYRFEVQAFIGEQPAEQGWLGVDLHIRSPWWRDPWVIGTTVLAALIVLFAFIRSREARISARQRSEAEKVRFQLEALRSQVDPHFLFNSFNTLADLIEHDPGMALQHLEKLSLFFRSILATRDQDVIPLGADIELLQTYFSLEQLRFGGSIRLEMNIGPGAERAMVVPLSAQMLAENAIKHNVATARDPLTIKVTAEDGWLTVSNPIRPKLSPPRSTGFGLESLQKRYRMLSDQPLELSTANGWFIVRIPLIRSQT